jgi:hypothetical protein
LSHPNPFYLFQIYELLYDRMILEEGAEVARPYKVHVSGTFSELTGEKLYVLFREFLIIVILMYPMPSLTLILDILCNFLVGVFQLLWLSSYKSPVSFQSCLIDARSQAYCIVQKGGLRNIVRVG